MTPSCSHLSFILPSERPGWSLGFTSLNWIRKINFVFILIFNEKGGGISKVLLCPVFFRKVSLFWEGSLEKWISQNPEEGRNRYAAQHRHATHTLAHVVWKQTPNGGTERCYKSLVHSSSESNGTREERERGKSKTHFHPSPWHVEPVLGVFSFHLPILGLRGFYTVPSALSSQEGLADLIINQDTRSLWATTPSRLCANTLYPLLAHGRSQDAATLRFYLMEYVAKTTFNSSTGLVQ